MTKEEMLVDDVMTKNVITVYPETPIVEAAKKLSDNGIDGMPVVDHEGVLVGILTEYDLISSDPALHLPTLQGVFKKMSVYRKDEAQFNTEVRQILALTVKDVMNTEPLVLPEHATFKKTVALFRQHHRVNPIPVVDDNKKVVGVVSRFDVLKPLQTLS